MAEAIISSIQNPKIKQLLLLQQKSSERRKQNLFVVEGQREIGHCIDAHYYIDTVYHCPEINKSSFLKKEVHSSRLYEVSANVYDKIAYRGSTEGIIALVKPIKHSLIELEKINNPLLIILEKVEKPGNLGAILRSADAAGVDGVIVCDPLTDLYNPNLIRSSIGAIFSVPCIACKSGECIKWLKAHDIQILTAQLQDSKLYYDMPMTKGTAIVMGTEATGLTQIWREVADAHIRIPMLGKLDSLNVSVSAAILMYEAVRQRQLNK